MLISVMRCQTTVSRNKDENAVTMSKWLQQTHTKLAFEPTHVLLHFRDTRADNSAEIVP